MGGIVDAIFGGGDTPSAPAPDPNIGIAAQQNAEVARESLAFNKQVYEEGKPRQARMDALSEKVIQDQLDVSAQNKAQAEAQWARFQQYFVPVEDQMVKDAMTYDSPQEQERMAGQAAADVENAYAQSGEQQKRRLASMGINPNSGTALAVSNANDLMKASDKAGGMNNARIMARDKGITLRAGAANFGRNMPNTAANAYGITLAGGNNAVSNGAASNNMALQNAAGMNQGFNTAINGNQSAGNLLLGQYGAQVNAWNAQQAADAQSSAGLGSMLGQFAGSAGGSSLIKAGISYFSSKKIKTNKQPIKDAEILEEVKSLPVEQWDYKEGEGDGGRHVGPYAEDVRQKFGDKAAPGGKAIDVISMNGITLSAVKALAKKVDRVETQVSRLAKTGIKRSA